MNRHHAPPEIEKPIEYQSIGPSVLSQPNTANSELDLAGAQAGAFRDKHLSTLTAIPALNGFALEPIEGDTGREFVATSQAVTLRFDGLTEVEAWLAGTGS